MSVNILYIDPVGNHSDEKSLFYSRESAAGTSISRHRQWNQHFWLLFALCFSTFSWICSFNVRNNIEKTVLEWLSGIYIYIQRAKEHMNTNWQISFNHLGKIMTSLKLIACPPKSLAWRWHFLFVRPLCYFWLPKWLLVSGSVSIHNFPFA